VNIVNRS